MAIASLVLFISFFKITLFYNFIYLSVPFAIHAFLYATSKSGANFIINAVGKSVSTLMVVMLVLFVTSDVFGYANVNVLSLFSFRILALFILSLLPALYLFRVIAKNKFPLKHLFFIAFAMQILFWLVIFINPGLKTFFYEIQGSPNSVNLREHNLESRGFGFSSEINFTHPFVMVLIGFTLFRNQLWNLCIVGTQLFNSNNVLVAAILGVFLVKGNRYTKVVYLFLIAFVTAVFFYFSFYEEIPRLGSEINSGGTRTLDALIYNHLHFLNLNVFEHIFGSSRYLYAGGSSINSDIGWVILYNYGGAFLVVIFFVFMLLLCARAFGVGLVGWIWFLAGVWLNFKGLLLGPNSYMFCLFLFAFIRYNNQKRYGVD
ncbi:hypothetical protein ACR0ST_02090 [Aliidiomarina sp. Khilg15.8]